MNQFARLIALALCLPLASLACVADQDCNPGSQCVKEDKQVHGVCMGGLTPGNANDQRPLFMPTDATRVEGSTCSFNQPCTPEARCVQVEGHIDGVCMRP